MPTPLAEVGTPAPALSLPDQDGKLHSLGALRGAPVVLYFYPKDDTPTCTDQACAFNDSLPPFAELGAAVLGISPDDQKSHAKFAAKFNLAFPILADVPAADGVPPICNAYGVWQEKSMYGRTYMGVARTTFLIGADGVIARRWDKVKVKGHVEEVLEALGKLTGNRSDAEPSAKAAKPRAKKSATPAKRATSGRASKPPKKTSKKSARSSAKKAANRAAKKARRSSAK